MKKDTYHHGNLRVELIEKGLEYIDPYGVETLSMRKLADSVGVSSAAPYAHFKNKDAFLSAVRDYINEQLYNTQMETLQKTKEPSRVLLECGNSGICPDYFRDCTGGHRFFGEKFHHGQHEKHRHYGSRRIYGKGNDRDSFNAASFGFFYREFLWNIAGVPYSGKNRFYHALSSRSFVESKGGYDGFCGRGFWNLYSNINLYTFSRKTV